MAAMGLFVAIALLSTCGCDSGEDSSGGSNDEAISDVPPQRELPTAMLTLGQEQFTIELATEPADRQRGLMFRKELAANGGMLFVFPNSQVQTFYMKNCLIDLDIVFIRSNGTIAKVMTMKAPIDGRPLQYYTSGTPVMYVLELSAGTCKRLNIRAGQCIELPDDVLKIKSKPK